MPRATLEREGTTTLDLHRPAERHYLAVARPLKLGDQLVGAMVVAKPVSQLRSRWVTLIERLAIALGGGVIVVGLLGVYLSRRITKPLLALSSAADEIAGGNYDVEVPQPRGSDEISHLSARFGDMAAKLAESEQLSRNFLMSVSHELRTPLTAIRGHVSALREGVIDDPVAREASLGVIGEEALRLERLVGDVLDLAKLDAHRFTVLREEVDMEQLCERAYAAFAEEARRRAIDYRLRARRAPGDRHRRRPRAADHLEPALERLPLDAGGRPHHAVAVGRRRMGVGRRRRHGAGDLGGGARADLPAVLVAGRRRHRARASRSRASSRPRSAGGSSCDSERGLGSRFALLLPATGD